MTAGKAESHKVNDGIAPEKHLPANSQSACSQPADPSLQAGNSIQRTLLLLQDGEPT